jgi:adenosylcobinamide-GDP ribazoletransferase
LLFLTTPYVRAGGLGSALASDLSRIGVVVVLAVTAGVTALTGTLGLWLLFVLAGTFILLRALMMLRIGGATGDTAGALIETSETALLIVAVLAPR